MHPRNRHRDGLDIPALIAAFPALATFVSTNMLGNASIDFAEPAAQRALSAALLKQIYGVAHWTLPDGALCPSVPGRADYVHTAADLLAVEHRGTVPQGAHIRALDLGVGANCVYPLIGHAEYGWRFVGTDIDAHALAAAKKIVEGNPGLKDAIELRLQHAPKLILSGVVKPGERFELTLCNPPFHASPEEASEGARRKWKNLGKGSTAEKKPLLNFGGRGHELWCPGGERAFVRTLIEESAALGKQVLWFTTLLSKSSNLPAVEGALKRARAVETRIVEMKQGQKTSRMVAWTFLEKRERDEWRKLRW